MSTNIQVLTVGSNPNLSFYAWRLQETNACRVTMVNSELNSRYPLEFTSNALGSAKFQPYNLVNHLNQLNPSDNFDIVFLSCTSLQDFQMVSSELVSFIHSNSIIFIESTGYINLEPFLNLSFGDSWNNLVIASVMNETDVRMLPSRGSNRFIHNIRNNDNRIYLGSSIEYNFNLNNHENFMKTFKLLQLVTEDSGNKLALLKSVVPKEFMTYQWKLALSRIVFSPLLVLFEISSPAELSSQILCKPLITGILNELLKIIKKMDCKLVKGYENEANLINYWSSLYTSHAGDVKVEYVNSPNLFYNYYHQFNLEIDLLLLQPILLGDDNGVRTPYLENLYSIICQLIKINDPESPSIFFQRIGHTNGHGPGMNGNGLAAKYEERDQVQQEIDERLNQLNLLTKNCGELEIRYNNLGSAIKEKEILKNQLSNDVDSKRSMISTLTANLDKQQSKFDEHQSNYNRLVKDIETLSLERDAKRQQAVNKSPINDANTSSRSTQDPIDQSNISHSTVQTTTRGSPSRTAYSSIPFNKTKGSTRDSVMTADNLTDLTDIAVYGAALNGEHFDPNSPNGSKQPTPRQGYQPVEKEANGSKQFQGHQQNFNQPQPVAPVPALAQYQGQPGQSQAVSASGPPPQPYQNMYNNNSPQGVHPQMNMNNINNMQMNQMNMNPMQMNQMNMNPMQMNQMNMNQMNQMNPRYAPGSKSRLNSLQSNGYYDNGMGMNPMQMQMMQNQMNQMQMMPQQMSNQMMPNAMSMQQMSYQQRPRAANRRSGFPAMDNPALIDMGGRGGMPMPGNKASRKSTSGIPISSGGYNVNGNSTRVDPETRHNKSMSTGNLVEQKLKLDQSQNLMLPQEHHDKQVQNDQPPGPAAKPLGAVSKTDDLHNHNISKKKKKGLFR
ncbi:hypothetical protein CANTEDRAFT_136308 [Yamadazyma tenuis ATCC 10573]|uniref:Ketopantoate reductase C-terminal domain-containing protein n=1 Tax=Candida tenuis (strain ATCC 10573 / BCRC 21748 / CBS 615 / JCM 9827 / NBRC 10315 / NRRL Y-1498 / VKM Y-70) TaxID=590646 RepID=G3B8F1_CANTC|nr:uncharacterized protein CANTEDRAFT_136308 [Yamadazyma tenuis ATCC 10573]EGV62383.1 hypothetical protein CANTEDRAFT_136308 [Yamadazyma tenuis ATCC 10573]